MVNWQLGNLENSTHQLTNLPSHQLNTESHRIQYASDSFANKGPGRFPSAALRILNIKPPHVVLHETKYGVNSRQFACTKSRRTPDSPRSSVKIRSVPSHSLPVSQRHATRASLSSSSCRR